MPENSTPHFDVDAAGPACVKALSETSKALKAFSFYPENHPLRRQILEVAYQAVVGLTSIGRVSLVVQRGGFSFADRQDAIGNNPMTRALAQELFTRELQRLNFFPGISLAEFSSFLSLLTVPPQKIAEDGGFAKLLSRSGIRNVTVDLIDISAVYTKKRVGESADDPADGADAQQEVPTESAPVQGSAARADELSIEEILAAMSADSDDETYRRLARMLLDKTLPLKQQGSYDRLFPVALAMVGHNAEKDRSSTSRGLARAVLLQVCLGEMTEHLLDHLEDAGFRHKDHVYRILTLLGAEVVDAVTARLFAAGSKPSRKTLMVATVRIGAPALPSLLGFLKDGRWQVVHTAAAILGEIGSRDAVKGLSLALSHPEARVRMETVRVLAKIGGMEATSRLLSLLEDEDQAIAVQAITWLGRSRSHTALQPLSGLVNKPDLFGKSHLLKKEALIAIGRIGDRQSLNLLYKVVKKRSWIAPGRRMELKLAAIDAIAALGGEQARGFLRAVAAKGGELGSAAEAALQRSVQRSDEHE